METKFTKGEWFEQQEPFNLLICTMSENERLISVAAITGCPEQRANAKLIAAAPEMFEALKNVLSTIKANENWWIVEPDRGGFDVSKIEQALKKATL